eukprot:1078999_1
MVCIDSRSQKNLISIVSFDDLCDGISPSICIIALLWRTLIVSYIRSHHTSSKDIRHILVMIISITSMALSTDLTTRLSIESVKLMNSIPYSYTPMSVEDTTAQSIPHQ